MTHLFEICYFILAQPKFINFINYWLFDGHGIIIFSNPIIIFKGKLAIYIKYFLFHTFLLFFILFCIFLFSTSKILYQALYKKLLISLNTPYTFVFLQSQNSNITFLPILMLLCNVLWFMVGVGVNKVNKVYKVYKVYKKLRFMGWKLTLQWLSNTFHLFK